MSRVAGVVAVAVVTVWLLAHLLYVGPVQDAAEIGLVWLFGFAAASLVLAAMVLLVVAMVLGRTQPAWLRFVRATRAAAAVIGCALVLIGLLHYRDTAPTGGEVGWLVLGLLVLAGTAVVHWWLLRRERDETV
ncbi:MAG TPA: hypothetical protein VFL90_05415 [Methylomirabilota bacterium]|nr:hypothetical protein [Methylomirabilota bacterium]